MEILEHLSRVRFALQEETASAFGLMAESVVDFLEEETLAEAAADPYLVEMFGLAGVDIVELVNPPKAIRKDQRKSAMQRASMADFYKGASPKAAAWGHEANAESHRAFGIFNDPKTSPEKKADASHEAAQAHRLAANHMRKDGHAAGEKFHNDSADLHMRQKAKALKAKDSSAIAAAEAVSMQGIVPKMDVVAWRMKQLKKKVANKKPSSLPAPTQEWTDLDEEGYSAEVKQASTNAGNATKAAKAPGASPSLHSTASTLHGIAHGVAKAHGHLDLAAKHLDFSQKHKAQADAAKVA